MSATKILVVDYDEPDLEHLVKQTFRKQIQAGEYEFVFCHTGISAINYLNIDPLVEIILTDVKMHLEDGREFLAFPSQMKRLVKTIVITPYGDIESIRIAMNLGAFDFVTRPINLKELHLSIRKSIEHLKAAKELEKVQNKLLDIEKELDIAKNIQNSILPQDFHSFSDSFEVFGKMIPAKRVGGDFFDFFPLDSNHLAFTIADVSGKGVPAALFMTMTRGLIRALGLKNRSPLECFLQLNELIFLENESSMFVTAFYGIFDVKTGVIEYCNAGHNPPYLIREDGTLQQIGRSEGIALGVTKEGRHFVQNKIELKKNDTLLLYTDGVTESMNLQGEFFQEEGLEQVLKANSRLDLQPLLDTILGELKQFSGEREQSDDITLFAIRNLR